MDRAGTLIGGYELIRPIGRGGMAEVWVARRAGRRAGKYAAVKLITDAYAGDSRFKRMFRAEAEISALLNHANIVQVFDEGQEDGRSYLVMEWVDGVNLLKIEAALTFIEDEPWRLKITAYVIGQLLHALSYAHSVTMHDGNPLGIVHRDVTPQNVLISARGEVKLTDFGVAHHILEQSSGTHVKGKIRYMAPEHLAGDQRDPRVDLYAVGAILHEMLDGRRFRHHVEDQRDMYAEVLSGAVPRLSRDVPPELDALRRGLLERDPERRIGTAERALELLERYPAYGDARRDLTELCSTVTGVVRPRVGPGSSGMSPVAASAERPVESGGADARRAAEPSGSSCGLRAGDGPTERLDRSAIPRELRADVASEELVDEDGQTVPQLAPGAPRAGGRGGPSALRDRSTAITRAGGAVVVAPSRTSRSSEVTATSDRETTMPGDEHARRRSTPSGRAPRHRRDVVLLGLSALSVMLSATVVSVLLLRPDGEARRSAPSVGRAAVLTERDGDVAAETYERAEPAPPGGSSVALRESERAVGGGSTARAPVEGEPADPVVQHRDARGPEVATAATVPERPAAHASSPESARPAARARRTPSSASSRPPSARKEHPLTIKVQVDGDPGSATVRLDGETQWVVEGVRTESIGDGRHKLEWKLPRDSSWRRGPPVAVEGCGIILEITAERATHRPYKNCK